MIENAAVAWTLSGSPRRVNAGETFRLELTAKIASGWHIYSMIQPEDGPIATSISLLPGQPFQLAGPIAGPAPESSWDGALELQLEYYSETAVFTIPVRVDKNAVPGLIELLLEVSYQECSETTCQPPAKVTVSRPVTVSAQV